MGFKEMKEFNEIREGFSNWSVEVKTGQIAGKKVKAQKVKVKAQSASHAIKLAAKKLGVDWKQLSLGKTQKESADEEVRESVEESTDLYNKDRIQVTRYSMGKGRIGVQISVDRDSINIDGNKLGALIKGLQVSLKKYKI